MPTYGLTDNDNIVITREVARISGRNRKFVDVSGYYGLTFATCVVADPESKGGSEATVRVAKDARAVRVHHVQRVVRTDVSGRLAVRGLRDRAVVPGGREGDLRAIWGP